MGILNHFYRQENVKQCQKPFEGPSEIKIATSHTLCYVISYSTFNPQLPYQFDITYFHVTIY